MFFAAAHSPIRTPPQTVQVAMVNKKFADKYFTGKDPLQQRINVEELIPGVTKLGPYISWQIVGVFNNVRAGDFRDDRPRSDSLCADSLAQRQHRRPHRRRSCDRDPQHRRGRPFR